MQRSTPNHLPATVEIDFAEEGSAMVLYLHGEYDDDNADALERRLEEHLVGRSGPVILDMADVSFVDSTVLSCLLRLRLQPGDGSAPITLRNPSPPVHRVLEIAGLLDVFPDG